MFIGLARCPLPVGPGLLLGLFYRWPCAASGDEPDVEAAQGAGHRELGTKSFML